MIRELKIAKKFSSVPCCGYTQYPLEELILNMKCLLSGSRLKQCHVLYIILCVRPEGIDLEGLVGFWLHL